MGDIRLRLRSVMNIQKITKSMKMVSAAKYARAERELQPARVYGAGANSLLEKPAGTNTVMVLCGDKLKAILARTHGDSIIMTMNELGKKPPIFEEGAFIAQAVLDTGYEFDYGELYYNQFKSVISYTATPRPIVSLDTLSNAETINAYDDVDADILRNYHEFSLANNIFYAMKEQACSEQSARMTAMDNASKNAGEMIDKLTLTFNRTRQAVITTELIEIISGSVALESKD